MEPVYFKTDISGGAEVICTPDGRIDFSALGVEFGLDPESIKLNRARFLMRELKSTSTSSEIEVFFK